METDKPYFFVYLTTDDNRKQLNFGITGDLGTRLYHLKYGLYKNNEKTVYTDCIHLVYLENFIDGVEALKREKEIRKLSFKKKKALVDASNPEWKFMDELIFNSTPHYGDTVGIKG